MATLKDISTDLGLSVATVSRALNGFPEVNVRTREKVRQAAERLGYRPNRTAQRLVTGRSGMVGMIVKIKPDLSADQTFFEMLTGLTAGLAAHEVDLVLAVDQEDDPVQPYRKMLERDILDGFILNAPVPNDPRIAFLQKRGIPFVVHGQSAPEVNYACYDIDNAEVSVTSVHLLTALGHRRIGLINGYLNYAYAVERLRGFHDALHAEGLSVPEAFVSNGNDSEHQAYAAALSMLSGREGPRPTAILCASTLLASGVMRAAKDLGLTVPQDLSIIAHDDALPLLKALNFAPALTVTRAPLRDAAIPLADLLVDLLVTGEVKQIIQKAELIVRASTGPVLPQEKNPWH